MHLNDKIIILIFINKIYLNKKTKINKNISSFFPDEPINWAHFDK